MGRATGCDTVILKDGTVQAEGAVIQLSVTTTTLSTAMRTPLCPWVGHRDCGCFVVVRPIFVPHRLIVVLRTWSSRANERLRRTIVDRRMLVIAIVINSHPRLERCGRSLGCRSFGRGGPVLRKFDQIQSNEQPAERVGKKDRRRLQELSNAIQ